MGIGARRPSTPEIVPSPLTLWFPRLKETENSRCYVGLKTHIRTQDIELCFRLGQCLQQCLKEKHTGIDNGILFKCWDCGLVLVLAFTLYTYRYFWVPYSKLDITYNMLKKGETPPLTRQVVKAQD